MYSLFAAAPLVLEFAAGGMGARRNFSRGGQNHRHLKKLTSFRRAVQKIDHFSARRRLKRKIVRFLRRFRLKYSVSIASAKGASENFKVFCRTAAYDVIFPNSRGGATAPGCPPPSGRLWLEVLSRVVEALYKQ